MSTLFLHVAYTNKYCFNVFTKSLAAHTKYFNTLFNLAAWQHCVRANYFGEHFSLLLSWSLVNMREKNWIEYVALEQLLVSGKNCRRANILLILLFFFPLRKGVVFAPKRNQDKPCFESSMFAQSLASHPKCLNNILPSDPNVCTKYLAFHPKSVKKGVASKNEKISKSLAPLSKVLLQTQNF